jgi:hypothetical protein
MEDGLAGAFADVDDDAVVVEPHCFRRVGDELEHPLRLVGRELGDLTERRDVPLGDDEEMRLGLGVDVADRDEAFRGVDVLPLAKQVAKEAVVRQRGSPPP